MLPFGAIAQQSADQRTVTTKIADVLAKFPANDAKQTAANVQQLESLGEDGLQQMVSMLAAPGKGDNTALEFAISAYTKHVMLPGKKEQRQQAVKVYGNGIKQVGDDVSRQFLIKQLELIGDDAALPYLAPYVNNNRLSGPATRAIAQVGTDAAGKLLLAEYAGANSGNRANIIEALGYLRYAPAASTIQSAYKSDAALKKIGAYALARIADPSSSQILHDAAQQAKFTYDTTNATSYYTTYLTQLAANKQGELAAKLATQMMNEAAAAKQTHARIVALTLLADFTGEKVMPHLYKAIKDGDIEYRAAALKIAERFRSGTTDQQWLTALRTAPAAAKVQLIAYLGEAKENASRIVTGLRSYLDQSDTAIRHATINALGRLTHGQEESTLFSTLLKKADVQDTAVIRQAMLRMNNDDLAALPAVLKELPPAGAVTALQVIAARRDERASQQVFELLNNSDKAIRTTALQTLPSVVTENNLSQLYPLLTNAAADDLPYFQDAVTNASTGITDTAKRISAMTSQMNALPAGKRYLFVPTLAAIGGRDALQVVDNIYNNGSAEAKAAVISALSQNKDARSASMLLKIAQASNADKQKVTDGYINIIQKGDFPAEQKVLMLEDAMSLAANNDQRNTILDEAGRNRTYSSLEFAAKYLDDAALEQSAAYAVMHIALAHPEFNGQRVRDLLEKVSKILEGPDSRYEREAIKKHLNEMPAGEGFVSMFNGKDLTGWKGLVEDPIKRSKMNARQLADAQKKADEKMKEGWAVKDGLLVFTGHGDNLATVKQYENFEMLVDWKITPEGDAGIYLRGTPQVQIWDTSRHNVGAEVGSGGLYNNQKNQSKPLLVADNPVGEWNNFRIIMKGDKVTVYLNGQLVTDNVVLENYWDRNMPIFPKEQIELQAHGTYVAYRNLFIKELPSSKPFELSEEEKKQNFKVLFDGTNLDQWVGNKKDYVAENNELVVRPAEGGGHGNLYTKDEYSDFNFRFEFLLTPGANNGLGIRAPLEGDAAYVGMELQILDNEADIYKDLHEYQYHGSVYGVIPAKRGFLKPVGQWNTEEVIVKGTKIKVILNNEVILDGDIQSARDNGTPDKRDHPGLKRDKGHIGFLGHGSILKFRNIRIKEL
jgi:hypothetical protein